MINSATCVAEDNDAKTPVFTASEISLIKSLSSKNYVNKPDSSNKVSGLLTAISFGQKLFFDPRLSGDGSISCSTCHKPSMAWGNHQKITSLRPKHPSSRHVPSLLGVRYNRWFFWDGRSDSLWSQATKPIENPSEMAGNRVQIAQLIINTTPLKTEYEKIFGPIPKKLSVAIKKIRPILNNNISYQKWLKESTPEVHHDVNRLFSNIGKAIAAFEETLTSKMTPFDDFANNIDNNSKKGQLTPTITPSVAMSNSALRGLKLFIGKAACSNCHFGPNFSDGEFHHSFLNPISLKGDLGRYKGVKQLLDDPFNGKSQFSDNDKKQRTKLDYVYQNAEFRGQFKTPSLRNVAKSFPYMHSGKIKTLKDIVKYYNTISKRITSADHQEILLKSLKLSGKEIDDLVEFLKSLSEQDNNTKLASHD